MPRTVQPRQELEDPVLAAAARMLQANHPGLSVPEIARRLTAGGPDLPELITIRTAANRLAVSIRTVERMLKAGDLPRVRISGCTRIPADAVRTIVQEGGVA